MNVLPAGMSVPCWCSFRGQRRAKEILLELELHRVTSHHVGAGSQTQVFFSRSKGAVRSSSATEDFNSKCCGVVFKHGLLSWEWTDCIWYKMYESGPNQVKRKKDNNEWKTHFKATGKKRMILDHNYQHKEVWIETLGPMGRKRRGFFFYYLLQQIKTLLDACLEEMEAIWRKFYSIEWNGFLKQGIARTNESRRPWAVGCQRWTKQTAGGMVVVMGVWKCCPEPISSV